MLARVKVCQKNLQTPTLSIPRDKVRSHPKCLREIFEYLNNYESIVLLIIQIISLPLYDATSKFFDYHTQWMQITIHT